MAPHKVDETANWPASEVKKRILFYVELADILLLFYTRDSIIENETYKIVGIKKAFIRSPEQL